MNFQFKDKYNINDLKSIMQILRGDNGCPWDKEQTHKSIRKNLIEETYEVAEAIDSESSEMLCEELGDLLLQIVFHSQMEAECGSFEFDDVVDGICQKLIVRHPHVFSDTRVNSASEVLQNWTAIKQKQKGHETVVQTLNAVPRQLPALMRSDKIQSRAAKGGYCYADAVAAFCDLQSELAELSQAIKQADINDISDELGDVLFAATNVARMYELDAEELLAKSCDKFTLRVKKVEAIASERGISFKESNQNMKDELWQAAKKLIQGE